nr:MAG TPA: Protein of unknown function (DUF551) [Caudoviricetes sp.]
MWSRCGVDGGAKSKAVFGSLRLVASAARKLRQLASFPTFAQTAAQKWNWRTKQMTIDRAIEILDPEHRENYDGLDEVNEACRMGMEALERTKWIPCSERLPEESGCYLVTVKHWYDGKPVTREAFWNGADWLSCEKRMEITPRVTHWMPMPEPPEEER